MECHPIGRFYLGLKIDMCFPRKPGLGHYNTPRDQWYKEYRLARIRHRKGLEPDFKKGGSSWKAQLIVLFERDNQDFLSTPAWQRLEMNKEASRIVDEILKERS